MVGEGSLPGTCQLSISMRKMKGLHRIRKSPKMKSFCFVCGEEGTSAGLSLKRKINEVWVKRDQECWWQQALAAERDPEQTAIVDIKDNRWNCVLRGCHHLCCYGLLGAISEIISVIFLNF